MAGAAALEDRGRSARGLCALAVVVGTAALLASSLARLPAGQLEQSYWEVIPGLTLGLRADATGVVVIGIAAAAALAALSLPSAARGRDSALLLCLLGTVTAALAGSLVVLFVGLEVGALGALLLATRPGRRPGRRALVGFGLEQALSAGLLAAAAGLLSGRGTTDLAALASAGPGPSVSALWALAGAGRLVIPLLAAGTVGLRGGLAGAAVGSVPAGVVTLMRLSEASRGELAAVLTVALAAAGVVTAVAGSLAAWRARHGPGQAGRALCLAAAGSVVGLSGLDTGAGRLGFAAGFLALELSLGLASAWTTGGAAPGPRWLAALALGAAGGLPVGFGTTALSLELTAVAAAGPGGTLLMLGLGLASLIAAMAAMSAALAVLSSPSPGRDRLVPGPLAVMAVSLIAAMLPGLTVRLLLSPLSPGSAPAGVDAGAVTGPGGGWAGGYLSAGALVALGAVVSAAVLRGSPQRLEPGPQRTDRRAPGRAPVLRWRHHRRRLGGAIARIRVVDGWLATQPGLPLVIAGIVAAATVVR